MRYFLPDSQDLVDPSFDFHTETRSADRLRQRDDQYAHEIFSRRAFDGILVSKAIVDGMGGAGQARYTQAQRRRLLREGARAFFRTEQHAWGPITFMGDCGAFSYIKKPVPPFSVAEVVDFYDRGGFDLGLSVDHVITDYQPEWESSGPGGAPEAVRARQQLTLDLAAEFLRVVTMDRLKVTPVGVAQGWGPRSYAHAVQELQRMGYRYIAVGGVVPLKTSEILRCLAAIQEVSCADTRLHLLGVTRLAEVPAFARHGVVSFDSTSPLRQAFMDARNNYYTGDRAYSAVRVPQVHGNARLAARIRSGAIDQDDARRGERRCLESLAEYAAGKNTLRSVLAALRSYSLIHDPAGDRTEVYREVLEARPWTSCPCEICRRLGYHVILFRGAERNRRRGLHNVWVFYGRVRAAFS